MTKHQILSAGDEETSSFLTGVLSLIDIDVISANTAEEAMKIARSTSFDAHILGVRFPDGNGFDLCRDLLRLRPLVPNAFLSGDVLSQDRVKALRCGADAYVTKPYEGDIGAFVTELIAIGRRRASKSCYKNRENASSRPAIKSNVFEPQLAVSRTVANLLRSFEHI